MTCPLPDGKQRLEREAKGPRFYDVMPMFIKFLVIHFFIYSSSITPIWRESVEMMRHGEMVRP